MPFACKQPTWLDLKVAFLYYFYIIEDTVFEYDPAKSAANKRKHGIDFTEAEALWRDPNTVIAPSRKNYEERYLVIGMIGIKHWTAIVTERNENTRLISVRRSRTKEEDIYEKNKSFNA